MGAAVKSGAACEETVAVGNLANVFIGAACGSDGAGAAIFPKVDILLRVESNNSASCGSGRGLNADAVLKGLCKKSVGVGVAEVRFGEEGELVKIVDALNIFRLNALFVHKVAVVGNVFVNVVNLTDELFGLKLSHLFNRHGFNFFLVIVLCHFDHPFVFWGPKVTGAVEFLKLGVREQTKKPSAFR